MRERKVIRKGLVFGTFLILITLVLSAVPLNATAAPTEEWVVRYNGTGNYYEYVHGLEIDSEGNIYVAFQSFGAGTQNDMVVASYEPDGTLRWLERYNGPMNLHDAVWAFTMGPDDKVYVTGASAQSGIDYDYFTMAYDTDGTRLWSAVYDGPAGDDEWPKSITVDPVTGNVYVTGDTVIEAGSYYPDITYIATVAYDSSGNELWVALYNGPANSIDDALSVEVNPVTGEILVAGRSTGVGTGLDCVLLSYDINGNQLWVDRYDGPNHIDDQITNIVIDPEGNIYAAGALNRDFVNGDICTIAYDSTGERQWVAIYDGPASGDDWGLFLTLGNSDHIYVSGWGNGIGTSYDYTIIAYDLSGNELWVYRYDGPAHGLEWCWVITTLPVGDIYVTGISPGIGTSADFATIILDSDGNLLHELRYDGPASGIDEAYLVAVDPLGNIYVFGTSEGIGTYYDMTLIKYSVSPEEALENLIAYVQNMDIADGIKNSLVSKLENAQKSLEKGNEKAALNQFSAFINEVEAQSGKKLTSFQATKLTASLNTLVEEL
jgi:hypothetical protein